jgi:carbon-monoxide dehydrogenase medium subunit
MTAIPALAELAGSIGDPMVRNLGTIGGSVANADPAACYPSAVLALDATIKTNQRTIAADDFFKGLFETALGPSEILTAIRVPAAAKDSRIGFAEYARRHGDYAMAGLAATAKANGKALSDVRLVYFGVGATPVRAKSAEAAVANGDIEAAVQALGSDVDPQDDVQADAATKMHLAGVLLRSVVKQLMEPRP